MSFDPTFAQVRAELLEAQNKFPPFHSYQEGYAVILEEVDELWTEIKASKSDTNKERIRVEAIQLAAMALRFLNDLT